MLQKFCIFIIVFLLGSVNAVAQGYTFKLENRGTGYCYTIGGLCFPELTRDENFNLPSDKTLAEERFARRREYVEKWYEKNDPEDLHPPNKTIEMIKALVLLPLFPVFLIAEVFYHDHQVTPEETERIKKSNEEYGRKRKELLDYVVSDCLSEKQNHAITNN